MTIADGHRRSRANGLVLNNNQPTSGWGRFGATVSTAVGLHAGHNVIRLAKSAPFFSGGTGFAELDYIQLT